MSRGVFFAWLVAIAAISSSLCSCDALFSTNLFQKVGLGAKTPTAAELGSMSVAELEAQSQTATFYEDLVANPSLFTAVETNLNSQLASPPYNTATEQEAAVLLANVYMNTTGANEMVVDLVGPVLNGTINLSSVTPSTAEDFIRALLPQGMTEAEFTASIEALCAADAVYDQLGSGMSGGAYAGDVNAGDVAQHALLAYVVSNITVGGSTPAEIAAALWNSNPFTISVDSSDFASGTSIGNIIDAGGLRTLFGL